MSSSQPFTTATGPRNRGDVTGGRGSRVVHEEHRAKMSNQARAGTIITAAENRLELEEPKRLFMHANLLRSNNAATRLLDNQVLWT